METLVKDVISNDLLNSNKNYGNYNERDDIHNKCSLSAYQLLKLHKEL